MTQVVVSRKLTLSAGADFSQTLADEFVLWKRGEIGAGDTFGKTTPFIAPPSIKGVLEKVHLEHEGVSAHWDRMLYVDKVFDPQAYTSDRLLVFGRAWDAPRSPFLLMTILDPAHDQMKNWPMLAVVGADFNAEVSLFSREYPSISSWVTSGF